MDFLPRLRLRLRGVRLRLRRLSLCRSRLRLRSRSRDPALCLLRILNIVGILLNIIVHATAGKSRNAQIEFTFLSDAARDLAPYRGPYRDSCPARGPCGARDHANVSGYALGVANSYPKRWRRSRFTMLGRPLLCRRRSNKLKLTSTQSRAQNNRMRSSAANQKAL